jgi:hypothetical protein
MKALDQLKQLKQDKAKEEYPSVPDYALPSVKYTDKTANGLTKCVIDWCILNGHFAERTSNEGRVIDGRKTYTDAVGFKRTIGTVKRINSSGTIGTSDVKAVINGRMVAIEIKIGKDRQSEAQKQYQAKIEKAGGIYWIVKSFDEFYSKYLTIQN